MPPWRKPQVNFMNVFIRVGVQKYFGKILPIKNYLKLPNRVILANYIIEVLEKPKSFTSVPNTFL